MSAPNHRQHAYRNTQKVQHNPELLTNEKNASIWYPFRVAVEPKTPKYMHSAARANEPPANLQPPRRVRRPRRGYTQTALIAWLDEQERLIRMRGIPNEVVREFDPLHNLPEPQDGDDVERGRRTLLFRFTENLESSIAAQIQARIVEHVKSCFMLQLSAQVELRHVEEANRKMDYYQRDNGSSPWFETLAAAENWVKRQEELRLENMRPPDTKMDLREDQAGVCQSHLGSPSFVPRTGVST